MPKVEKLTDKRKGYVNARYAEYGIEKITTVLRIAGSSDFLNGKNDRVWKADFEWLMRPENFVKVLEGKYGSIQPTPLPKTEYRGFVEKPGWVDYNTPVHSKETKAEDLKF